uniref:Uncharacterized protein n=1 Tax=Arundo donax TaxID=35708 RepID=A0A0A9G3M9_ARUDO
MEDQRSSRCGAASALKMAAQRRRRWPGSSSRQASRRCACMSCSSSW